MNRYNKLGSEISKSNKNKYTYSQRLAAILAIGTISLVGCKSEDSKQINSTNTPNISTEYTPTTPTSIPTTESAPSKSLDTNKTEASSSVDMSKPVFMDPKKLLDYNREVDLESQEDINSFVQEVIDYIGNRHIQCQREENPREYVETFFDINSYPSSFLDQLAEGCELFRDNSGPPKNALYTVKMDLIGDATVNDTDNTGRITDMSGTFETTTTTTQASIVGSTVTDTKDVNVINEELNIHLVDGGYRFYL